MKATSMEFKELKAFRIAESKALRPVNPKKSFMAKRVADTVIEKVRKGEHINMQVIQREAGYSSASSRSMKATDTETYKTSVTSFLDSLDEKRRLALAHITGKKLAKSTARDNAYITDVLTKNYQLLSGQATENVNTKPTVIVFGSTDPLATQLALKSSDDESVAK